MHCTKCIRQETGIAVRQGEEVSGMRELIYTANDEEPKCGRCDNICESDELCVERCGPEHCWGGYIRTVNKQEGGAE